MGAGFYGGLAVSERCNTAPYRLMQSAASLSGGCGRGASAMTGWRGCDPRAFRPKEKGRRYRFQ